MSLARVANRLFDRQDFAWFDLLVQHGDARDIDRAVRTIPTDQLEAVLESRAFNAQIERSL